MNPKERAKELIERFEFILNPDEETYNCTECKSAALICVDEIMGTSLICDADEFAYWNEVKKEIEKTLML